MKRLIRYAAAMVVMAGVGAAPAWAGDASVDDMGQTPGGGVTATAGAVPQTRNGIAYVNGGVGLDEQATMRAMRGDYNLYLTFSTRGGAFQAGVQVDIWDARGNVVLSVPGAGPLLFVKLPPGAYKVAVSADGRHFERKASVDGRGGRELVFTWGGDDTEPATQE